MGDQPSRLTRRRDREARHERWHIWYDGVRVGTIGLRSGAPGHLPPWEWSCGFYPGSHPGEYLSGNAENFAAAREAFERAWAAYLPKRTPADFKEWREHQAWTAEKYARWDRGERAPHRPMPAKSGAESGT